MEVITSHTNADFDTLASMLAAKKLYPRAHIVFPGSMEKGLRRALKDLTFPYEIEKIKDIELEKISRLILVDIKQASRIGPFRKILQRPDLDVHIYDHHPDTDEDIKGSLMVTEPVGSTTTILTHIIKERSVPLTPQEATILMAGIYEDTGFLSYPSTTTKDYQAAAFLLERGADLGRVSDLLSKELTPEEVAALNEFLQSATTYTIGGVDVVIAEGSVEDYKGDVALIAHKMRDIERIDCLFLLADAGDRIHLVARSRSSKINVGSIAKKLGGGGHRYAASASLKGLTTVEAKERLLEVLKDTVPHVKTAEEVMSAPPITVSGSMKVSDALDTLRRFNINAVPVVENDNMQGIITRQVLDKALHHGLGDTAVRNYMTTDFAYVTPQSSIEEIRETVIGQGQRLLPVVKDGRVVGVITRKDILKLLQEELKTRPSKGVSKKSRHLKGLMKERLPAWVMELLVSAGETAEEMGYKAYVVGGFVRDLLLRRDNLDIDLVIEGDGIRFAKAFAGKKGLRVRTHERFSTAVLIFPDGFKCDVATARLEYYERPGALPRVELSSLKLDLYRRDFTINTMAIALNPKRFGELIDFFDGQRDLKEKTIRVLHNLSFVEDPTRALRAVRFAEKFGFRISAGTMNLIKNTVRPALFRELSGARILYELKNILEEDGALAIIKRLDSLGLLTLIHEDIRWDRKGEELFEKTIEACIWFKLLYRPEKLERWLALFLALTDALDEFKLRELARRLSITGKRRMAVINSRARGLEALGMLSTGRVKKRSAVFELLSPLPLEVIIYLMAKTSKEEVRKTLSAYITGYRTIKPLIGGEDLKRMGVPEGPLMGHILKRLFEKRLDGEISSREEEEALAKELLAKARKKGFTAQGRQDLH